MTELVKWQYQGWPRGKTLEQLGREGWEMCSSMPGDTSAGNCEFHTLPTYIFKRPLPAIDARIGEE